MKTYVKLGLGFLSVTTLMLANWLYRPQPEHIHIHAGFVVYIDGVKQDYSDYKFMNFEPCTEHDTKKSASEEQVEKAHLHDSVDDVVHVHRNDSVWGDLFKNIKVTLPTDGKLVGYINGVQTDDIMNKKITPYDTAEFIVGESKGDESKQIIPVEHIKEIEAKSELCGKD